LDVFKHVTLNGIFLAIVAHGVIGISLIWDKILLKKPAMKDIVPYVFWLGATSVFGLVLIPFGFHFPGFKFAGLAFTAGLLDLIASYFYYAALQQGEASEELAAMGGFSPVATAVLSLPFLHAAFGGSIVGFVLMSAGGFLMFVAEKQPLRKMLPRVLLASIGFGLTNVLQKIVFNGTNFVSGYVFFTVGTAFGSLMLLLPPHWREQVFENSEKASPSSKAWYMVNRIMAGIGSFLVVLAVARTAPSTVEAISGLRYVIIFILAYAITKWKPKWFQEDFSREVLIAKSIATALIVAGLVLAGLRGGVASSGPQ